MGEPLMHHPHFGHHPPYITHPPPSPSLPSPNAHHFKDGPPPPPPPTTAPYAHVTYPPSHHPSPQHLHHPPSFEAAVTRPRPDPVQNRGGTGSSAASGGSATAGDIAVNVERRGSAVAQQLPGGGGAGVGLAIGGVGGGGGGAAEGGGGGKDGQEQVEGQPPAKKRRNRRPISCKNCRRRKLKCDRGNPCGSCRDRNEADLCSWDDAIRLPPDNAVRQASVAPVHPLTPSGLAAFALPGAPGGPSSSSATSSTAVNVPPHNTTEALELRSQLDRLEGLLGQLMDGHPAGAGAGRAMAEGYNDAGPPPPPSISRLLNCSVVSAPLSPGGGGKDAYARLLTLLPPPRELQTQLLFFHAHIHYLVPIAHMPTLFTRLASLDRSANPPPQKRDPALVGLLLGITAAARIGQGTMAEYAGALAGYTGYPVTSRDASPAWGKVGESVKVATGMIEGAAEALEMSNYMEKPTIDALRLLILLIHFYRFEPSTLPILVLSQSITIARTMGLNRDPARHRHIRDAVAIEEQRRIWAVLKLSEAVYFHGRGMAGMLDEADVDLPANANDEDISSAGVKAVRPMAVVTDATPLLVNMQVAEIARRINKEVYALGARPSYEHILKLNQDLLELDQGLPPSLKFPWATRGGILIPKPTAAGKEWFRFILHLEIRALYIRLHHPFLIRGYIDEQFAFNRNSVLTAARFILACHRGLGEDARALSCRFVVFDVCNALLCLIINIFQDTHGQDATQDRVDVEKSLSILHHCEATEEALVCETVRVAKMILARVDSRRHSTTPSGSSPLPSSSSSAAAAAPGVGGGVIISHPNEHYPNPNKRKHGASEQRATTPPQLSNPVTAGLYTNGAPPAPSPIPPPPPMPMPNLANPQGRNYIMFNRSAPFPRPLPLPMSAEAWIAPPDGAYNEGGSCGAAAGTAKERDPLLDVWDRIAKMPAYAVPDRVAWRELVEGTRFAGGLDILQS